MANNNDNNDLQDLEHLMDAPTPMDDDTDEATYPTSIDCGLPEENDEEGDLTFELDHYTCINGKLIRKGENGHADIYYVNDDTTYEEIVLKLYQPGKEPKDMSAFVRLHENYRFSADPKSFHLLPLMDYGYYQDPETGKERFYELTPYMQGGSLNGIPANTSAETLKDIIFSIAKALYILHQAWDMAHGDVKLSNLFLTKKEDGQILLGDYDSLTGEENHKCDYVQLAEMLSRFKVAQTPEFQKLINRLEAAEGYEWTSTLIGEWFEETEGEDSVHGTKAICQMPYEDIVYLAEIDVSRQNHMTFPNWTTDICTYAELLSQSGYEEQGDWVEDCNAGEGCAPYTTYIHNWKQVYGLKEEAKPPRFSFLIKDLESLESFCTDDAVKTMLREKTLKDWITIFFHENPWKPFTEEYEYEHEVERYLEYIRKLDPDDENVRRLDEARATIMSDVSALGNQNTWKWGIRFTQAVCGLLFVIPALIFTWWMIFKGLPFEGNPYSPTIGGGVVIAGCIVGIILYYSLRDNDDSNGCGCLLAGLGGAIIFGVILYLTLKFMSVILAVLPWLCVILMLGLGVWVYFIIFNEDLETIDVDPQNDPDMWTVQPLYYAFDTSKQGYEYRQQDLYRGLPSQYRDGLKKMVLMMIVPILLAWGAFWGYKAISPEFGGKKIVTIEERLDKYAGEWSGTFDEKPATMQILSTRPDSFSLSITVTYQKAVTQTFTGKLDGLIDLNLENDTPDDNVLDGSLDITINYDHPDSFHGKYKNYTTEKTCLFSFKKIKAENDSVQ